MAKRKSPKLPISRATLHRYRKEGYDVDTNGKPDPEKVERVKAQKATKLRFGASNREEAQEWDVRFRKAKALDMERQLAVNMGELIPKREVERQAFETGRRVRDYLLNIPNRIAGEVAAALGVPPAKGQEKVYQILNREIQHALEHLK